MAEISAFISTHLSMLADKSLSEVPISIIRTEQCNAEWAAGRWQAGAADQKAARNLCGGGAGGVAPATARFRA